MRAFDGLFPCDEVRGREKTGGRNSEPRTNAFNAFLTGICSRGKGHGPDRHVSVVDPFFRRGMGEKLNNSERKL